MNSSQGSAIIRGLVIAICTLIGLLVPPAQAHDWHICKPFEKRHTCIVDGDTFWLSGEKMRLFGVDTPEMDGRCQKERDLSQAATGHLQLLLSSGIIAITRHGQDDFGRTLVEVDTQAGPVGPSLLARGVADRFGDGVYPNWCR